MDEAQAEAWAVAGLSMTWATVDRDAGGVGGDDAGENLDEGGFAGAVLAHQRVDLAGLDAERRAAERGDTGIGLADVAEGEKGHGLDQAVGVLLPLREKVPEGRMRGGSVRKVRPSPASLREAPSPARGEGS